MRGFSNGQSIGSCHDRHMKIWVAAIGSLLAGFCVFIAFGAIAVNRYDEKPNPWWLVSMLIIAIVLISAPILGAILAALADILWQHRRGRLRSFLNPGPGQRDRLMMVLCTMRGSWNGLMLAPSGAAITQHREREEMGCRR